MRKVTILLTMILALALSMGLSEAAQGGGDHSCQTPGSCSGGGDVSNTNTNTNQNVNQNSNENYNRNINVQGQQQGQLQGQSQGQVQGQGQSQRATVKNSGNNTGTANVSVSEDYPRQAPPAFAPSLTAVPETCMGSTSFGGSSPFGGVSFGTTWKSDSCEARMNARALQALGYNEAALALLAQDEKIAKALADAGVSAPGAKKEEKKAEIKTVTPKSPVAAAEDTYQGTPQPGL